MPWSDRFDAVCAEKFPTLEILREEPMNRHTTFRVGGPARRMVCPASAGEFAALLALCREEGWPCLVVGNGSNLLVRDGGIDCVVLHTGGLEAVERTGETTLRAQAGVSLARLAVFAQRAGLTGLEFAHGIPGSLGGAVCMNAGAYGGEMCQVVCGAEAWFPEGGVRRLEAGELDFGYRHSLFSHRPGVVLSADFSLAPGDTAAIRERMEDLIARRREKQPLEYPSAGSTFKRPAGHYAGALIEGCGLKGASIGGAKVSEKHAGFIINTGGATCADILALIDHVREVVAAKTGVLLEPEVRIVG